MASARRLNSVGASDGLFLETSDFARIGAAAKAELARVAIRRSYGPNQFIYLQDDDAEYLYFIQSGHVRLSYLMEDGSAVLHGILPPGESFGELGVFESGAHCDMATAMGQLTTMSIPADQFRLIAAQHPDLMAALTRTIARRYRSYIVLTRDLSLKTLPARLAQALLRVADGLGVHMAYQGRRVPFVGPLVTQTDLGLMARGSRGNVNRALKAWERAGWIAIHERSIAILERDRLEALSLEEGL